MYKTLKIIINDKLPINWCRVSENQQYHHAFEGPQENVMLGRHSSQNLVNVLKEHIPLNEITSLWWVHYRGNLPETIWFRK